MLMQHLGPLKWPVAYLSKCLDLCEDQAGSHALCMITVALMSKMQTNWTPGQELHITAPMPLRAY